MEQLATTPSVLNPKIQFREPPFTVDGRILRTFPVEKQAPSNETVTGRLSLANSTNGDPSENWTRTTAEKDSWVYRERRRSSIWTNIDLYPSSKPDEGFRSR